MKYFNIGNEALNPYKEYDEFTLYCIDISNRTAGLELYLNSWETDHIQTVVDNALRTAFEEHNLYKVYVNIIRDDYCLYETLEKLNFVFESIHRAQYFDSKYHDIVYMTVLRPEWERGGIKYSFNYHQYNCEI